MTFCQLFFLAFSIFFALDFSYRKGVKPTKKKFIKNPACGSGSKARFITPFKWPNTMKNTGRQVLSL
jgi:hypothetical protein